MPAGVQSYKSEKINAQNETSVFKKQKAQLWDNIRKFSGFAVTFPLTVLMLVGCENKDAFQGALCPWSGLTGQELQGLRTRVCRSKSYEEKTIGSRFNYVFQMVRIMMWNTHWCGRSEFTDYGLFLTILPHLRLMIFL